MNQNWNTFLLSQTANQTLTTHADKSLYALSQLAVLTISGNDAGKLLQGQITCNINDITEESGSLGALCNPKGRAIATFLLVKKGADFLMVLPRELLEPIKKRLQMYVLRAQVTLTDSSDTLCLIGVRDPSTAPAEALSCRQLAPTISVNFFQRTLLITEPEQAIALWQSYLTQGFTPAHVEHWHYLDIVAGMPWLTLATSEQFIPQMLNLDQLGGISFNKGCYTGQEIIARTHYLGKAKRALFLAECNTATAPAPYDLIVNDTSETAPTVGHVLAAQQHSPTHCTLLVVLQLSDDAPHATLKLKNQAHSQLTLLATD